MIHSYVCHNLSCIISKSSLPLVVVDVVVVVVVVVVDVVVVVTSSLQKIAQ